MAIWHRRARASQLANSSAADDAGGIRASSSTPIRLARSPALWPPMPSATAQTPSAPTPDSLFLRVCRRTLPTWRGGAGFRTMKVSVPCRDLSCRRCGFSFDVRNARSAWPQTGKDPASASHKARTGAKPSPPTASTSSLSQHRSADDRRREAHPQQIRKRPIPPP